MREVPVDIRVLASDLGINNKELAIRTKKRGLHKVKRELRRDWIRLCGDQPRLLAKQNGHYSPQQYTVIPVVALGGEPEAVSASEQQAMTDESRRLLDAARWRETQGREFNQRVGRIRTAGKRALAGERDLTAVNARLRDVEILLDDLRGR